MISEVKKEDNYQPKETESLKEEFSMWCHVFSESSKIKKNINSSDYELALMKIATFKDKETFWNVYQHLKKPRECEAGVEFELFKKDIRPVWEDPENIKGGKFSLLLEKEDSALIWEEIILAFCGGIVPFYQDINGVCLSVRKTYDVIQFWFRNFEQTNATGMRNELKKFFKIPTMVNMKMKTFEKLDQSKKNTQKKKDYFEFEEVELEN